MGDPKTEDARKRLPSRRRAPIVTVDTFKNLNDYPYNPKTFNPDLADGYASRGRNVTYVRRGRVYRRGGNRLAGLLEHEQAHLDGADEKQALLKELETLITLGGEQDYIKELKRFLSR